MGSEENKSMGQAMYGGPPLSDFEPQEFRPIASVAKTMALMVRTQETLNPHVREHIARMIDALDQLYSEALMVEQAHKDADKPHYSLGLEMARGVLDRASKG